MKRRWLFLSFAAQSLARRWSRSFAIAFALASSVATLAAALLVTDSLSYEATLAESRAPDLVVSRLVAGRPALLDLGVLPKVAALPGVLSAHPRVWGPAFVSLLSGNVTIVGTTDPKALSAAGLSQDRGECALGDVLSRNLGVRVGDKLHLDAAGGRKWSCSVRTIFSPATSLFSADLVVVTLADARTLLGVRDADATDLALTLSSPDETAIVVESVASFVPGARLIDKRLVRRIHALALGRRTGFVLGALLPVLLSVLVLVADRLSGVGAREAREIAIVKAVGWSVPDVLFEKALEAFLLAFVGTGVGLLVAYTWAFPLGAPGLRSVLGGWSHVSPTVELTPTVSAVDFLAVLGLVVLPFVGLSVLPAYRVAVADPVATLREG